jgi:hypothetical protein
MSTVWNIATVIISAIGATTSVGLSITAWASTPKPTASSSRIDRATPTAMPRPEKRAPSVMSGIANHAIVGTCGPPLRATLLAMMTCEPAQLASSAYSGRLA